MAIIRSTSLADTLLVVILLFVSNSYAYRPGDIVPMSKRGQYHSSRTTLHDMIGRHCPIFGVDREVLIPIAKPIGYTGADPFKEVSLDVKEILSNNWEESNNPPYPIYDEKSFQIGREKFLVPWLLLINRKSPEVPMIDIHLRYSGSDMLGVTANVVDMPHKYVELHPDIRKQFWDAEHWPKHVLVRYTWEEQSEIDLASGFFVLFGTGLAMSVILAIYILQTSRDKLARFVQETVAESSIPGGGVAKVE